MILLKERLCDVTTFGLLIKIGINKNLFSLGCLTENAITHFTKDHHTLNNVPRV